MERKRMKSKTKCCLQSSSNKIDRLTLQNDKSQLLGNNKKCDAGDTEVLQASASRNNPRKRYLNFGKAQNLMEKFESDRIHLSNIFPEEVWLLIFEKADPITMENAYKSSLFLREVLLSLRVHFMFENVLKVLEKQSSENFEICDSVCNSTRNHLDGAHGHTSPGHTSPGISCHGTLSLRLVCRSWCTSVDNFYQNHPAHLELKKESGFISVRTKCLCLSSINMMRISSFVQEMGSSYPVTGRNPFFGNSVRIVFSGTDIETFQECIQGILQRFGTQIWYLYIYLLNAYSLYSNLKTVLELVPNLKVLHVQSHSFHLHQVQSEIASTPLPTLERLEVLNACWLAPPVSLELLRTNAHLSTIKVRRRGPENKFKLNKALLPNLSSLSYETVSHEDFLEIFHGSHAKWHLTSLHLDFSRFNDVNWMVIFQLLSDNFKRTLKHLSIKHPHVINEVTLPPESYMADFPRLTHLEIIVKYRLINLDFLLPLRNSLTDFRVKIQEQSYDRIKSLLVNTNLCRQGKVMTLLTFQGAELGLNIVKMFPKLESFQFDFRDEQTDSPWDVFKKYWSCNKK